MTLEKVLSSFLRRSEHNFRSHRFGYEFGNPQKPRRSIISGKIGTASEPAHADHQHPLESSVLAIDGSVSGSHSANNEHLKIYGDVVIAYVTGVGGFTINFPSSFTNGLINCIPVLGDDTGATSIICLQGGTDKTKFKVKLWNGAVEAATANYRIWYEATGW